ncbi:LPS export ABC transporter periplasmic protein LptC [Thermodesulfobacteriota bacterium]
MTGARNLLWIIPLMIFVTAPSWWQPVSIFLQPRSDRDSAIKPPETIPKNFLLEDVTLIQNNHQGEELRLTADKLYTVGDETRLDMEQVETLIYGTDGTPMTVTSGEALYDSRKRILTLLDDVHFLDENGFELHTQALRYLVPYRIIKTALDVELIGNNSHVLGTGFFYDLESGAFRVGGRVLFDTR